MRTGAFPVALVAAAVLAGCGGSDETATTQAPAATAGATTHTPAEPEPPATTATEPATAVEQPAEEPATTAEEPAGTEPVAVIRLVGGEPADGVARIEARRGETVSIRIRSDRSDEVHVHGYDLMRPVGPGKPAMLTFVAELEGIFEIETHGSGALIAELVVRP